MQKSLPTSFDQIYGHDDIKSYLSCMLEKKALAHALLFVGEEGVGKSLFCWALASKLLGEDSEENVDHKHFNLINHPDIHIYRPEGKLGLHSIQTMRQLSEEIYYPPFTAKRKVFVIYEADRMLSYSANALLKTFEEPPQNTIIILIAPSQSSILSTIVSRCRVVHFKSLPDEIVRKYLQDHFSMEDEMREELVFRAKGSIGRAVRLMHRENDVARPQILKILGHPPIGNYRLLQDLLEGIIQHVDQVKIEAEHQAKKGLDEISLDSFSVQQKTAIEKELEGLSSVAAFQEAQCVLGHVLSWYRDLELMALGGSASKLLNPDFASELEQSVQRGDFYPLDKAYQAIEEALLSLQRSTSFGLCLENLFLKLGRV